jgi:hypothetical protein
MRMFGDGGRGRYVTASVVVAACLGSGVLGAGLGAGVTVASLHRDAVATAVCETPVLGRALVGRFCPEPGAGYLEGSAPFPTAASVKP